MEYISVKEFSRQDKKVQKALIEWWKDNITMGDLFDDIIDGGVIRTVSYYDKNLRHVIPFGRDLNSYILDCIPLLTEGQLRRFVEDKTGHKVEISYRIGAGYIINLTDGKIKYDNYLDLGENLLQVYWKVACEIAKKEVIITHGELRANAKFKIKKEPESVFIKDSNIYDGACNSYKLKSEFKDNIFEPTIFSKDYEVIKL